MSTVRKNDSAYPRAFLELHDAPDIFYARGELACLKGPAVAVVGTRGASEHGLAAARAFARDFGRAGICVVSGLAFGCDAAAHRGALDAGSRTVAVVGSGIDDASLYPRGNFRLAKEILERGGLIISENPPGTKPANWDFPKRNRLIAALARATAVIEAPVKSGALITAKYALELGREVYAVPADALRESAKGSNVLLASGAAPLLAAADLLAAVFPGLAVAQAGAGDLQPRNADEAAVLKALGRGPAHIDEIIAATGWPAAKAQSVLTALELRGAALNLGNSRYRAGQS